MPEAVLTSTTSSSPSPTRRTILRRGAAAAVALAVPATALPAPHPDAALLDLCARIVANDDETNRLFALECAATDEGRDEEARVLADQGGALTAPYIDMIEELIRVPAHTRAGLRAKAEVLSRQVNVGLDGEPLGDWGVAWSVAHDALRLLVPA